jgi:hypothetical protein
MALVSEGLRQSHCLSRFSSVYRSLRTANCCFHIRPSLLHLITHLRPPIHSKLIFICHSPISPSQPMMPQITQSSSPARLHTNTMPSPKEAGMGRSGIDVGLEAALLANRKCGGIDPAASATSLRRETWWCLPLSAAAVIRSS